MPSINKLGPPPPALNHMEAVLNTVKPQIKYFNLNGKKRPAFRLGLTQINEGVTWLGMSATALGICPKELDYKLKSYIQSHAIKRLEERLNPISILFVNFYLMISLMEPQLETLSDGRKALIISVHDIKVGYLPFDIVDHHIIFRTFLFITCNGTPESEALKDGLALSRDDISFLKLDQLNTFIESDILENSQLISVINEICPDLLNLKEFKKIFKNTKETKSSEQLVKYLCLDDQYENIFKEDNTENSVCEPMELCDCD